MYIGTRNVNVIFISSFIIRFSQPLGIEGTFNKFISDAQRQVFHAEVINFNTFKAFILYTFVCQFEQT